MKRLMLFFVIVSVAGMLASCNNGKVSEASNEGSGAEEVATKGTLDGHDWVDLGLSVKWATCNVGAKTPEEFGDYFAWGEAKVKENYSKENYNYYDGSKYIKYSESDNLTALEEIDDAVATNWGKAWRTPTKDELEELADSCTWTWINNKGYEVKGKNGNTIFIPAAGKFKEKDIIDSGSGFYWSDSFYSSVSPDFSWSLTIGPLGHHVSPHGYRYYGLSVRPVCAK